MRIDGDLSQDLLTQLDYELGADARDIKVTVFNGLATLRGSVPSYADKLTAIHAVKHTAEVLAWSEDLEVKLPPASQRADAEIVSAAINAINWVTSVPAQSINIEVRGGWLWLGGVVDRWFQKEAAEVVVCNLTGVKGVTNLITIKPCKVERDVKGVIHAAIGRHALLDAKKIKVETMGTKVVLQGNVPNIVSKDEAERAAWTAKGVTAVDNRIAVGTKKV